MSATNFNRRDFIKMTTGAAAALSFAPWACQSRGGDAAKEPLFKISLAQWSLHKSFFSQDPAKMGWVQFGQMLYSENYRDLVTGGTYDPLDFARIARQEFGIDAIEYVNTFYFDRAKDSEYLAELKNRADSEGVTSLLIMCDAEGNIGAPEEAARTKTVENHYKWVEAAKFLGCHSIRVNAASDHNLSPEEQQKLAADGLRRLCEYGEQHGINIIVENHGGISSDASWLAGVMELVDHPRVGTLPDFGNFWLSDNRFDMSEENWYDRNKGVGELMPYAKAVSAKSHKFDENGDEVDSDFRKLMKIVVDAGYRGYVGIEYEGQDHSEPEGIRKTKALLERIREEMAG